MRKLTTAQAAARLGVTPQTLYAYVSRGVIGRTLAEDGRSSRFDPAEVESLARRGRPRGKRAPGRVAVSMASSITHIDSGRIGYRGHDLSKLCESASFERVAALLWTGALPQRHVFERLVPPAKALAALQPVLSPEAPPIERFMAVCAVLAGERTVPDRRAEALAGHGGDLLLSLLDGLRPTAQGRRLPRPARTPSPASTGGYAEQLWRCLSPQPPRSSRVRALDRALILLADHELATSTLAVRVAASTRADPYAAVMAGLATASGPLHGRAASSVHRFLRDAGEAGGAEALAVQRFHERRGRDLPGFGHPVYPDGDPRAPALLTAVRTLLGQRKRRTVDAALQALQSVAETPPNVDFALGALAYAADMPVGATDAIFVLARVAGWLAHAIEEYTEPALRFRARATYEGP